MNLKQKICLWLGIITIVLMGVFPPWVLIVRGGGMVLKQNEGYKFILTPAERKTKESSSYSGALLMSNIDFSRLGVQWALVAVVTGGLLITFKDKKQKVEPPPSC
jgi:hypothetical protein